MSQQGPSVPSPVVAERPLGPAIVPPFANCTRHPDANRAPLHIKKNSNARGEGEKGAFVKSVLVEWGKKCAQCMLSLWLIILRNLLLAETKGVESRQQQHTERQINELILFLNGTQLVNIHSRRPIEKGR